MINLTPLIPAPLDTPYSLDSWGIARRECPNCHRPHAIRMIAYPTGTEWYCEWINCDFVIFD